MKVLIRFFCLASTILISTPLISAPSYRTFNRELGIAYSVNDWDMKQWNALFGDASPPAGWAIVPVGSGGCKAISPNLLKNAKTQGFHTGLLIDPFVSAADTKQSIDCAVPLGIRRVILDEYVSYQTNNLKRALCTVLSEVNDIYRYSKQRYPSIEIGIDDNWHTWAAILGPGQSNKCGNYPYFQMDLTGVSVLSKYGNPLQNKACGRPTRAEMEEQLLDLKPILKDYSRSGKIFLWQLNQHWYPGGAEVLQLFRQARRIFGWQRFLLFGPTADDVQGGNWGYNTRASQEGCVPSGFQWYLPARDYLIRIAEGKKTAIRLQNPGSISLGNTLTINGAIRTSTGIPVNTIALQVIPQVGSTQTIRTDLVAPKNAVLAFVGAKVNTQVPYNIKGNAQFRLDRVQLFEKGSTRNLVANSDFNNDFSNWVLVSTGSASIQTSGSEKSVVGSAAHHQTISLSSFPIIVIPGRTYTIQFDAGVFQEARNNGYFYISWNSLGEERRDRFFMRFPNRQTVATASSNSNGSFRLQWQPTKKGTYQVFTFFAGNREYQPSIASLPVTVN